MNILNDSFYVVRVLKMYISKRLETLKINISPEHAVRFSLRDSKFCDDLSWNKLVERYATSTSISPNLIQVA